MNDSTESNFRAAIAAAEKTLRDEKRNLEITQSNIQQLEGFAAMHRENIARSEAWLANARELLAKRERLTMLAERERLTKGTAH